MTKWTRGMCAVLVALQVATPAWAGPLGGSVAAGQATIGSAGAVTEVRQATDRAIVNWQSFSTAASESVKFVQPSATSVTLNRVTGDAASSLHGSLSANGRVFISNPNGIHFGSTSKVNVGSLVASTLAISDGDFMRGNHRFTDSGKAPASVVNDGHIQASGSVALVAPLVANHGTISAPNGRVSLAAGSAAQVDLDNGLVRLEATAAAPRDVVAGTDGNANPLAQVVNNQALVEAGGVVTQDGRVILKAAEGTALNTGTLEARQVVIDSTRVSAVTAGSRTHGDDVRLLSRGHAALPAGSRLSSPGGFVEISGKRVTIAGTVDTRAPDGRAGQMLIDPEVLTIQDIGDGTPNTVGVDFIIGSPGDLTLQADSEIVLANTTAIDMNGRNLTLRVTPVAPGNKGDVTAVTNSQINNAGTLTIVAGSPGATVASGVFDLGHLDIAGGNQVEISVFGTTSSRITLGTVVANDRITVNASSGVIEKGSAVAVDLSAPDVTLLGRSVGDPVTPITVVTPGTLTIDSGGDIGVFNQVAAARLVVETDAVQSNRILVDEVGGQTTLTAPGTNTIAFTNAGVGSDLDFTLTTGDLALNTVDAGSKDLSLTALSGDLTGDVNTTGHLVLEAGDDIDVTNTSASDAVTVRVPDAGSSQVRLKQNGTLEVEINGQVSSTVDSFTLITASGDIDVNSIIAAATAHLEARGGDIRTNATTFTADTLELIALGDISGNRLIESPVASLDAGRAINVVIHALDQLTLKLRGDGDLRASLATDQPAILTLDLAQRRTDVRLLDVDGDVLRAGADGILRTGSSELRADLSVIQRTGDLRVGDLISSGPLALTAEQGAVLVESGERIKTTDLKFVTQDGVQASDGSAVLIETATLDASAKTGDLLFHELDGTRVVGAQTGRGRFDLVSDDGTIEIDAPVRATDVGLSAGGPTGKLDSRAGSTLTADTARLIATGALNAGRVSVSDLLELATTTPGVSLLADLGSVPDLLSVSLAAPSPVRILATPVGDLLTTTGAGAFITPPQALLGLPLLRSLALTVATGTVDLANDLVPGTPEPFSISGALTVNAPGGSIRLGEGQLVSADAIALSAAGAVGTRTGAPGSIQARTLGVTTAGGDVSLFAQGDLTLDASSAGSDLRLGVNGTLTLAGNVNANGALQLNAAGDIRDSGLVDHVLSGQRIVLAGADLGDGTRPLRIAAPVLDAAAQDDAFLRAVTSVEARTITAGGQLALQGLGDLALGALSGSAVLVQSFNGVITDANGAAQNVVSPNGTVGLFATRGVGTGDAIETTAAALVARTATGNIEIAEFDTAGLSATATAGDVKVSSDSGWLILDAVVAGGRAELRAVFGGLLDANGNALNVTAQSILFALCDTAGTVSDALEVRAGSLDATAFGVFIEADGALRVDQLTSTFTNRIRATGDVTLGRLASTRGIVDVISVDGAILDGNGGAANLVVVSGGESRLIAGTTIGVGDALEVDLAPGFLTVAAGAARGGISAAIDGSTAPGNFVTVLSAPGSVLFRGRVQGNGPTGTGQPSDGNAAARTDPAQSLAASIEGKGSVSAADSAGSSAAGPRERSDLIDDSRAND